MTFRTPSLAFGAAALAVVLAWSPISTAMQAAAPAEPAASAEPSADGLDPARIAAGVEVYKEARCRGCHGWAANGEKEGPNPVGPSIRATQLAEEDLRLTVACGRPGTDMPYFWKDAYKGRSTDCYGATKAELGDALPPRANVRFSDQQLADLAYYLANYVKGRGDISFEDCELFYGAGAERCAEYPKAATN